jgi:hypothetical protein
MAKNMLKLLQEEHLQTFKANARERSKIFSLDTILPMYENIYVNLANKK